MKSDKRPHTHEGSSLWLGVVGGDGRRWEGGETGEDSHGRFLEPSHLTTKKKRNREGTVRCLLGRWSTLLEFLCNREGYPLGCSVFHMFTHVYEGLATPASHRSCQTLLTPESIFLCDLCAPADSRPIELSVRDIIAGAVTIVHLQCPN